MNKHTQVNDMADERPDDPQKPVKSVQSPPQEAGVLRDILERFAQQIEDSRPATHIDAGETINLISAAVDGMIPPAPSNELIQEALQNGKPQQAASYNGFAAAIAEMQRRRKEVFGE